MALPAGDEGVPSEPVDIQDVFGQRRSAGPAAEEPEPSGDADGVFVQRRSAGPPAQGAALSGDAEAVFVQRRSASADSGEQKRRKPDKKEKDKDKKSKKEKKGKKDGNQKKPSTSKKDGQRASGTNDQYRLSKQVSPPTLNGLPSRASSKAAVAQKISQATESSGKQGKAKSRKRSCWLLMLRGIVVLGVIASYAVVVVYLVMEVLQKKSEVKADKSDVCKKLQCPSDSVCVDESGKGFARCSKGQRHNLQILQIVLGIVAGVPAAICLPCSAQWLFRTGCHAWYTERSRRWKVSSAAKGSQAAMKRTPLEGEVLGTDDEDFGEHEEVRLKIADEPKAEAPGLIARLSGMLFGGVQLQEVPDSGAGVGMAEPLPVSSAVPESTAIGAAQKVQAGPSETDVVDDDSDEGVNFFVKTGKKKEAAAGLSSARNVDNATAAADRGGGDKDDIDVEDFFVSAREVKNVPPPLPPPDVGLAPPDEDGDDDIMLDAFFAKASKKKPVEPPKPAPVTAPPGVEEEPDFEDFFHRPARRANGSQEASPEKKPPVAAPGPKEKSGPAAAPGKGAPRPGTALPPMPTSAPNRAAAMETMSKTEFSEGISAIFAAATKQPGQAAKGRARSGVGSSMASSKARGAGGSQSSASQVEDDEEEEQYVDETGEAPDFIGYALAIGRKAPGAGGDAARGDEESWLDFGELTAAADAMSEASVNSAIDSLADMEACDFADLFHDPL